MAEYETEYETGYEAAVRCKEGGEIAKHEGSSQFAKWCSDGFRWEDREHKPVPPEYLMSPWWKVPGKKAEQPDCPEGYELWPLGRRASDKSACVDKREGIAENIDPERMAGRYPDRFCGWRFELPNGRVFYRLDSWQVYPVDGGGTLTNVPRTPINATHALMRKE